MVENVGMIGTFSNMCYVNKDWYRRVTMKIGVRKPSVKKSFKARTTAKWKRELKSTVIPWYGKKGAGWLHPKRKIYNKVYSKTTVDALKPLKDLFK